MCGFFFPNYEIKPPSSNPDILLPLAYLHVPCVHLVLVAMEILCREYGYLFSTTNIFIAYLFHQGASVAKVNNML